MAMWWWLTLEITVSRFTGTYSKLGTRQLLAQVLHYNWNGFLHAGPDDTRLSMLEGNSSELSKVISEWNTFQNGVSQ